MVAVKSSLVAICDDCGFEFDGECKDLEILLRWMDSAGWAYDSTSFDLDMCTGCFENQTL